jgi:hypothetical protein
MIVNGKLLLFAEYPAATRLFRNEIGWRAGTQSGDQCGL